LGCLLYKLAYFVGPFDESLSALAITNAQYTIPNNHYSERFLELIKYCLTVDPDNRPNIFQVIKAIGSISGKKSVLLEKIPEKYSSQSSTSPQRSPQPNQITPQKKMRVETETTPTHQKSAFEFQADFASFDMDDTSSSSSSSKMEPHEIPTPTAQKSFPFPTVDESDLLQFFQKPFDMSSPIVEETILHSWDSTSSLNFFNTIKSGDFTNSRYTINCELMCLILLQEGHPNSLFEMFEQQNFFGNIQKFYSTQNDVASETIVQFASYLQKKVIFHSTFKGYEGNYSLDSYFLALKKRNMTMPFHQNNPISIASVNAILHLLALIVSNLGNLFIRTSSPTLLLVREAFWLFTTSGYVLTLLFSNGQTNMQELRESAQRWNNSFNHIQIFFNACRNVIPFQSIPKLPFPPPKIPCDLTFPPSVIEEKNEISKCIQIEI